jgi:O-methyltransferase involved in polyketide biosynthesis
MAGSDPSRISPTALYTSYVWYANGMSHAVLAPPAGLALHTALRPANLLYDALQRRPNLDLMLLARHRVLDHLLEREIEAGRVRQVVEVAAGLSPRGYRFAQRYREQGLRYLEGDLPESAARKRRLLDQAGLRGANHEVVTINALLDDGPASLASVCASHLEPGAGTAIITEGLLGYFDLESVEAMWRRFATALRALGGGVYLSDLNLGGDASLAAVVFNRALSWFARGQVFLHFDGPAQAEGAVLAAGFDEARARVPDEFEEVDVPRRNQGHIVRLLEARVLPAHAPR